jgi:2-aminoadipate transaminase
MSSPATAPLDFKRWVTHVQSPLVERLLKEAAGGPVISFAGALPEDDFFPTEAIEQAFQSVIAHNAVDALQYYWCEGYAPLREQIAAHMTARGVPTRTEEVLITNGAQQALDLLGKLTLRTGDNLALENPTYSAAIQAFELQHPRFSGIARSERSFDFALLEETLESRAPKLLYLVATGHNPTGASLNAAERRRIVEMTTHRNLLVIEDEAYGELQYDTRQAPIQSMANAREHVVYVGSFSKILSPGLRVGWIAARADIVSELSKIKQASDLQTGSLNQVVLSRYLEHHNFHAHIHQTLDAYRARRDALVAALERHFPAAVKWSRPTAGFSSWVELPAQVECDSLLKESVRRGVAFEPGKPFFPGDTPPQNFIRLSFSNLQPAEIEEGVRRLGAILSERSS